MINIQKRFSLFGVYVIQEKMTSVTAWQIGNFGKGWHVVHPWKSRSCISCDVVLVNENFVNFKDIFS